MNAEQSKLNKAFNIVKDSRRRFISSIVVVLAACAFSLIFGNRIILFFESLAPAGTQFVAYQLEANFELYVRVSLYSGIVLASPFLIYQVIRSLTPVLNRAQKMYLFTFLPLILVFFVLGIVYTTYVFMPLTLKFALGFVTQISTGITPMVDLGKYISFLTKFFLVIGIAFELPVIIFILSKFGLVSHQWLASKWRWGILGSAVIAALVTPTGDVFHDSLKDLLLMDCGFSVSIPIFILYFLSIFMAWLGRKPKPAAEVPD